MTVEDASADWWTSQVVFFAESEHAATTRQHQAGFFKRNAQAMPPEEAASQEFAFAADQPGRMFLRRSHDSGWSPWYALPPNYQHPPQGLAARSPEIRRLPGETPPGP